MSNRKIRFIINPKSGTGNKSKLPSLIEKNMDPSTSDSEICITKSAGHAVELANEAVANHYDVVVAVGGDGSVNETASALVNSNTSLGIIPTGSGNGLARHLKIPVNAKKAIGIINTGTTDVIDTLSVNDRFCVGTIGVGFDAHIAHLFSHAKKRGYSTYVKLVLAEFSTYKIRKFSILVDETHIEKNCFLLTFANSSQFGNNAVIAPFADVKDGLIEISMMRKFPVFAAPGLIFRLMNNSIHRSDYFTSSRGRNIVLKNTGELQGHIDGEPVIFTNNVTINIKPLSLRVIVP